MKNVIYYFTGTGNSLAVARQIAEGLGDTALVPIPAALAGKEPDSAVGEAEAVGLVFPTYMHRPPHIVVEFITQGLPSANYYFSAAVNAGDRGQANRVVADRLGDAGQSLQAGFSLTMPSNYLPFGPAVEGEARRELFQATATAVEEIVDTVRERRPVEDRPVSFFRRHLIPGLLYGLGYKFIPGLDKNFQVSELCNSCGLCAEICPVSNIQMDTGRPVWLKSCQQCFACLHFCPQTAIEYGRKTAGLARYHHPDASAADIRAMKPE